MINIAGIKAYVIYLHNFYKYTDGNGKLLSRLQFMLQLHQQLCEKGQREHFNSVNLSRDQNIIIKESLEEG